MTDYDDTIKDYAIHGQIYRKLIDNLIDKQIYTVMIGAPVQEQLMFLDVLKRDIDETRIEMAHETGEQITRMARARLGDGTVNAFPAPQKDGEDSMKKEGPMTLSKQGQTIAGICVAISDNGFVDYDELLREAIRIALRFDTDPEYDDFDELYTRIHELMDAYIHSPEGDGVDTSMLMARLATCIADVIPLEERKQKCAN